MIGAILRAEKSSTGQTDKAVKINQDLPRKSKQFYITFNEYAIKICCICKL